MSVLVAYSSAHGSTREIAERIAERIAQQVAPAKVDCLSVEAVPPLCKEPNKYNAVVVGSAVHMLQWLRPARRFLRTNSAYLSGVAPGTDTKHDGTLQAVAPPVWAFSVGMPRTDKDFASESRTLEAAIERHIAHANLKDHTFFRGAVNKSDLNWFVRAMTACCVSKDAEIRYGDHREWGEVERWADHVGKTIMAQRLVTPPASPGESPAGPAQ